MSTAVVEDTRIAAFRDEADALLAAVGAGDQRAFAELYDALSARVFGLVLRVVGNRALAEEVLQETFLMVWQQARSFMPTRGSATSWVYVLAHRRAIDCVRRTQASTDRDHRAGFRALEIDRDVVSDHVVAAADAEQLRIALRGLTRRQRSFLSLAYYGGHSHSEIAEMTGTPLGTVKTSLRDAVAALRKKLNADVAA